SLNSSSEAPRQIVRLMRSTCSAVGLKVASAPCAISSSAITFAPSAGTAWPAVSKSCDAPSTARTPRRPPGISPTGHRAGRCRNRGKPAAFRPRRRSVLGGCSFLLLDRKTAFIALHRHAVTRRQPDIGFDQRLDVALGPLERLGAGLMGEPARRRIGEGVVAFHRDGAELRDRRRGWQGPALFRLDVVLDIFPELGAAF